MYVPRSQGKYTYPQIKDANRGYCKYITDFIPFMKYYDKIFIE